MIPADGGSVMEGKSPVKEDDLLGIIQEERDVVADDNNGDLLIELF